MKIGHILLSRTDSIGDVILTLPLAGLLKEYLPGVKISFMGMPYTRDVIESCLHVDKFIDWSLLKSMNEPEAARQLQSLSVDVIIHVFPCNEIAKLAYKARIPLRIGTTGRLYHWWYCNKRVAMSRKNSDLHESVLNLKLASPLIDTKKVTFHPQELSQYTGLQVSSPENTEITSLIDKSYINVILHPRSKGSAREWGIDNFAYLAMKLATREPGKALKPFKVFISGTRAEGEMLKNEGFFEKAGPHVIDVTGKFNLKEFMQFINACDAMIAGSTGPLHIASALNKIAIGLYPPIRPMHPGRWMPIGKQSDYIVADKECSKCRKTGPCECMQLITPHQVEQKLEAMVLTYYSHNMPE